MQAGLYTEKRSEIRTPEKQIITKSSGSRLMSRVSELVRDDELFHSLFRGNDTKGASATFYETVNVLCYIFNF